MGLEAIKEATSLLLVWVYPYSLRAWEPFVLDVQDLYIISYKIIVSDLMQRTMKLTSAYLNLKWIEHTDTKVCTCTVFAAGRAPCDLRTVEGFYVVQRPRSYAFAMPKGHPYLDEINSALLHIQVSFLLSIKLSQIILSSVRKIIH